MADHPAPEIEAPDAKRQKSVGSHSVIDIKARIRTGKVFFLVSEYSCADVVSLSSRPPTVETPAGHVWTLFCGADLCGRPDDLLLEQFSGFFKKKKVYDVS